MTKWLFLAGTILLVASHGTAQIVGPAIFTPANPNDANQIRAAYTAPGLCGVSPTTAVNGIAVRTTVAVAGCLIGPPAFQVTAYAFFGPLPAGAYTYELYSVDLDAGTPPHLVSTQPLVVTASSAPTLSPALLLALILALAGLGWFRLAK
ncbi:MAG TPA: hypothetical protein VEZ11_18340 [Thermoanaerobaculia bacterium]|nr:hypothetical protein [Thermoanaerobaculia bacterium]